MTIETATDIIPQQPSRLSGWMHAALALSLVSAQIAPIPLPGLSIIGVTPAQAQRNERIQCFSQGNRPNSCNLPSGTQSVTFLGPDRSGRCQQGSSWQQRGNQLWVSNGCGGTFEAIVYGGGSGGWGGSGGSGNGNEITCRSLNGRTERCQAYTGNRVRLVQQFSSAPCIQGRSWSYDRNSITVRDGCQARFSLGSGNGGGSSGGSGGGWGGGNSGSGFAGSIECRSQGNRYQRCSVNTQNRVQMIRQLSNTQCYQNRNWGYDRSSIWVDNGCSGQFGVGYGNDFGGSGGSWDNGNSSNNGSNTGEVVAGVALAAGLVALLAAAGRSSSNKSATTSSSATIDADMQKFPADSRRDAQACLNEAARQIGATGGSRIRLNEVDAAQRSGDGWMILGKLSVTYDNQIRQIMMDCRSTSGKVTAFDVR